MAPTVALGGINRGSWLRHLQGLPQRHARNKNTKQGASSTPNACMGKKKYISLHKTDHIRQSGSKLSWHSPALFLQKTGGTRQSESKLSLRRSEEHTSELQSRQ